MLDLLVLGIWALFWGLGGIWLAAAAFRLTRSEQLLVGLVLGLTLETLLANILGRFISPAPAFLIAAGLTFLLGAIFIVFKNGWRALYHFPLDWRAALALLVITGIFTQIGRGLAIFDDYAHLPTTSLLAAGSLPLKFALNPDAPYTYHYFLMLFAAQITRLGDLAVWFALDLSRAFAFGLTIVLAFIWSRRITRSIPAGILGALTVLFAGGSRWLALLFPGGWLENASAQMTMVGSGSASGSTFATALTGPWAIEGGASLDFPFAFVNGVLQPGVLSMLGPNSTFLLALTFTLLLTYNRWRSWVGAIPVVIWVAAFSLLTESGILLGLAGWGLVLVTVLIKQRNWRIPAALLTWLLAWLTGTLLGAFQGGALAQIILDAFGKSSAAAYQTVGFQFAWPPILVSTHLGALDLSQPATLLLAIIEAGPLIFILPLTMFWGWKALRAGRWYEAALITSGLLSLGVIFVQFAGSTGIRNTARLYEFMTLSLVYAVPLGWLWAQRQGWLRKTIALSALCIASLGGLVVFGVELTAMPSPTQSYYLNDLDAVMMSRYWDKLEPDALVFDPLPNRSPVLFARYTNAAQTWYAYKPEWLALKTNPNPVALHAAGYDYLYLDSTYWEELSPTVQVSISDGCAQQIDQIEDWRHDTRWLYDLRACGE